MDWDSAALPRRRQPLKQALAWFRRELCVAEALPGIVDAISLRVHASQPHHIYPALDACRCPLLASLFILPPSPCIVSLTKCTANNEHTPPTHQLHLTASRFDPPASQAILLGSTLPCTMPHFPCFFLANTSRFYVVFRSKSQSCHPPSLPPPHFLL